jgi:hypothetical protein
MDRFTFRGIQKIIVDIDQRVHHVHVDVEELVAQYPLKLFSKKSKRIKTHLCISESLIVMALFL